MFVPTDKAFRALLVQLGGPDRAEDKFRENPRLLIGVIIPINNTIIILLSLTYGFISYFLTVFLFPY